MLNTYAALLCNFSSINIIVYKSVSRCYSITVFIIIIIIIIIIVVVVVEFCNASGVSDF